MANKHSRDFGLHHNGAGKGDRPRTDTSSKLFQDNYREVGWDSRDPDGWGTDCTLEAFGFTRTGPTKWTKRFK